MMRTPYTTLFMVARNLALMLLLTPSILLAQEPPKKSAAKPAVAVAAASANPKLKGIWEPVSYPADVHLNDVYFVTPEIGWVSAGAHGQPGMIIHTKDGGASWTAQLGDPESSDPAFHDLRFIDARTGWALQNDKLLHTSDGESWSQTGSIEHEWGVQDYTFISPRIGLYIDGNANGSRILRSSDGGRTWREVFACKTTLQIEGLTKKVDCALRTLHFPSRRVGYALGGAHGAKRTLFVAKTEDGGETWKLSVVPDVGGDNEVYFGQEAFFTDEATGVVSLSDNRIYRTTDGGRSWKGGVGTPGPVIRFADPLVGWSFTSYRTLSYTTDGGNRWTTREFAFPTKVSAFSLPRRDRAFVVGEHGMIYRYRVLPAGEAMPAKALAAPAMPVFDSPLDEQVTELAPIVDALAQAVASAPDSATGQAAATPPAAESEDVEVTESEGAESEGAESEGAESEVAESEVAEAGEEDAAGDAEPDVSEDGAPMAEEDVSEMADAPVAEEDVSETADVGPAEEGTMSAFTAGCCAKPLGKFDLILATVTGIVPQFLGQHKNTNLLLAGLRMLTDLPGRINELNGALRAFRKAPDKAAAKSALAKVTAAVQGLTQSTAVAFQKQLPPPPEESGQAGAAAVVEEDQTEAQEAGAAEDVETAAAPDEEAPADEAGATPADDEETTPEPADEAAEATPSDDGVAAAAARAAEEAAKKKAKEKLGKSIKKKLRF